MIRASANCSCENGGICMRDYKCECPENAEGERCELRKCIHFSLNNTKAIHHIKGVLPDAYYLV